jgi:hypothetical protein
MCPALNCTPLKALSHSARNCTLGRSRGLNSLKQGEVVIAR